MAVLGATTHPIYSFKARPAAQLNEFTFVKRDATDATGDTVTTAGVGDRVIGVNQHTILAGDTTLGDRSTVWGPGTVSFVRAGAAITAGTFVTSDATGRAIPATEGAPIAGQAQSTVAAANALVPVLLVGPFGGGAGGGAGNTVVLEANTPAYAAGVSGVVMIGRVPGAGTITGVSYAPNAAVTGADTNTRTISVLNRGPAGAGSTSTASLALVSGTDLVGFGPNALTLSGTPANRVTAAGEYLSWSSTHAASGLADPGGLVRVTITLTN